MSLRAPHFASFLVLLVVLGCSGRRDLTNALVDNSSDAVDSTFEAKRSDQAEREASAMRRRITLEVSALQSHAWAGEYYAGDGLAVNTTLVIAPGAGFVFEWRGCLGLYDRNYGPIQSTGNVIELSCTHPNTRQGFQGIATNLIVVPWGGRSYLVPADDIVGFCNNVNQGREPRTGTHGFYFLRRGDETKPVRDFPKVPEEYREYLVAKPIEAAIASVGAKTTRAGSTFKGTPVTIDAGASKGIRVGMELFVMEEREAIGQSVDIVEVAADRSRGVITHVGDGDPKPRVGWRVSTRAPWHSAQTHD